MTDTIDATVIIVGAGPAGSTAAYFLANAGVDVLMVDQATFPRDKSCGDSICPGAVEILDKMGLSDWAKLKGYATNIGYRLSSPNGSLADIPFPSHFSPFPNYLIPRREFDHALVQHAVSAGARLREGVRLTDFARISPEVVQVMGKQDETPVSLTAKLVIAADGSISAFTSRLGMVPGPADALALRQYYSNVAGTPGQFELHWEKSVLPAYGFIFHLNDGIAVFGTGMFRKDQQRLKANIQERLKTFITQNPYAREALKNAQPLGPVAGHPYRDDAEMVKPYADNIMLVGDAAGTGHPMTGEGIGPAMISAEIAAHHAIQALEKGDVSEPGLAAYGLAFHKQFDSLHKISQLARTALALPWMVDRTVRRCAKDPVFGAAMAGILAGVVSPGEMLKPGMALRLLAG
ncbi:MAG: NAD(P)/FAD-dependent oxidoreductase [Anaerolineales bacterium]|jgi:geranylgeranyl reductase family protein|nr:NAD(P)/FAD-dependent oxidoreductase [Anaerolineales bacterium]